MVNPANVIKQLMELPSLGVLTVQHVSTFEVHRRKNEMETQTVTVRVYDAGENAVSGRRYSCTAQSEDGLVASGNSAASLEEVFATLHWWDLNKDTA
jgi:hypothetical protein